MNRLQKRLDNLEKAAIPTLTPYLIMDAGGVYCCRNGKHYGSLADFRKDTEGANLAPALVVQRLNNVSMADL